MSKSLIKIVDDKGNKFLFDPSLVESVHRGQSGIVMSFLKRKGPHTLTVKYQSPTGASLNTVLSFNKKHRALATQVRLKGSSV